MARMKAQAGKRKRGVNDSATNNDQSKNSTPSLYYEGKTSSESKDNTPSSYYVKCGESKPPEVNLNLVDLYMLDKDDLLRAIILNALKNMDVSMIRSFDSWIRAKFELDDKFSNAFDSYIAEAVEKNNVEFVECLLRFDVCSVHSSFHKAAQCNNVEMLKMLNNHMNLISGHSRHTFINALNAAAEDGATLAIQALIEMFDYEQEHYIGAACHAIVNDNLESLECLYGHMLDTFSQDEVKYAIQANCSLQLFNFILTNSAVEHHCEVDDLIKIATNHLLELITEDKSTHRVLEHIARLVEFKRNECK